MKNSSIFHRSLRQRALGLAAGICALVPVLASAGTTTVTGDFRASNGDKGNYTDTITTNGSTTTFSLVFTRSSDNAQSTDTITSTKNDDGSRSVTESLMNFGATTAFTTSKTVTKESHGELVGSGTYTTPSGDTGTLSTLESKAGDVNVVSGTYTSGTTGVSQLLRLEEDTDGFIIVKTLDLTPGGTVAVLVTTRYITNVTTSN